MERTQASVDAWSSSVSGVFSRPADELDRRVEWLDARLQRSVSDGVLSSQSAMFFRGELAALQARFYDIEEDAVPTLSALLTDFLKHIRGAEHRQFVRRR